MRWSEPGVLQFPGVLQTEQAEAYWKMKKQYKWKLTSGRVKHIADRLDTDT